jgi:PiT family inorganic phosphate transporter
VDDDTRRAGYVFSFDVDGASAWRGDTVSGRWTRTRKAAGALEAIYTMPLLAHAAIALGTLSGGWRIVHTMGSKITKLRPVGGFSAETAGAVTLFAATFLGIPVSTTHTITGAIAGVGSTTRLSAVKWRVAGRIVWAWILTIPAAAMFAAVAFFIAELILKLIR